MYKKKYATMILYIAAGSIERAFTMTCPGSTVFGSYMSDTEVHCMPVDYHMQAKAIDDGKEEDNENC